MTDSVSMKDLRRRTLDVADRFLVPFQRRVVLEDLRCGGLAPSHELASALDVPDAAVDLIREHARKNLLRLLDVPGGPESWAALLVELGIGPDTPDPLEPDPDTSLAARKRLDLTMEGLQETIRRPKAWEVGSIRYEPLVPEPGRPSRRGGWRDNLRVRLGVSGSDLDGEVLRALYSDAFPPDGTGEFRPGRGRAAATVLVHRRLAGNVRGILELLCTRSDGDVDQLYGDVLALVYASIQGYSTESVFGWTYRIVRSCVRHHRRLKQRATRMELGIASYLGSPLGARWSGMDFFERADLFQRVIKLYRTAPHRNRIIWSLYKDLFLPTLDDTESFARVRRLNELVLGVYMDEGSVRSAIYEGRYWVSREVIRPYISSELGFDHPGARRIVDGLAVAALNSVVEPEDVKLVEASTGSAEVTEEDCHVLSPLGPELERAITKRSHLFRFPLKTISGRQGTWSD